MRKSIVSSALRDPDWDNTTVAGITRLKEQPGRDIVQYGFGRLSQTMLGGPCPPGARAARRLTAPAAGCR